MSLPNLNRRFFRLTALNILANVTTPLVGLVDAAMLGHLPEIAPLAGVALGGVIFDYLYWTCAVLRMGTTGLTAQAVGRGDRGEVERTLRRSLVLAMLTAAALLLLRSPIADAAFRVLAGEPAVEAAGRAYFDARIWGAPAALANLVLVGWFLGREESRLVVVTTVIGNVANIALNYVFIVQLGLAAQGAGIASAISQYLTLAIALALYLRRRHPRPGRWRELFGGGELTALLRLHRDILLRTLCLVTCFAVFTNFSALFGVAVLAANTLLLRLLTLAAFLIDGAAFAVESLAGILHGRGDRRQLRRLLRLALATGAAFAALFALLLLLAPRPILGLLTSHGEVIAHALAFRFWMVATLLLGAGAYILDGYFIGLTAGRILRDAMLVSTFGVFLPLALAALMLRDPHLLWLSLVAFMAARGVTLGRAVRGEDRDRQA